MFKYKIGYAGYDDSESFEFEHERPFSRDEITDMVGRAVVECIRELKRDEEKYYVHDFGHVGDILRKHLVRMYGFKPVEYKCVWEAQAEESLFVMPEAGENMHPNKENLLGVVRIVNAAGFGAEDDSYLCYMEELRKKNEEGDCDEH